MKKNYYIGFIILLFSLLTAACSKDTTTGGGKEPQKATDLNKQVDEYLAERYLWNGEYNALDRDPYLAQAYVDNSDNFLKTVLRKMTTNTLDKKSKNGQTQIYSYLRLTSGSANSSAATRGVVNHPNIKKEQKMDFGIASMDLFYFVDSNDIPTGTYGFGITGIYPDSPASDAGLKRGMRFSKFKGSEISSEKDLLSIYYTLTDPTKVETVTLTENRQNAQPISVTSRKLYPNPVLYSHVFTEDETGYGSRIGYMVYNSFDAAYDDEVLDVLKEFKNAGISEMILDLRNNGGGHVITSKMLSSCIVGEKSFETIFQYYRYNDTRMANTSATSKETGNGYDQTSKRFYESYNSVYYGANLSSYALNLNRLYVLVSGSTASSSEAVINSLKAFDGFEVVLIGSATEGKNVGMEVQKITANKASYELAPITFQSFNAKLATVNPAGIPVDYTVKDDSEVDFGEISEPLLAKALSLVTGRTFAKAGTRAFLNTEVAIPTPKLKNALSGMIVFAPETVDE